MFTESRADIHQVKQTRGYRMHQLYGKNRVKKSLEQGQVYLKTTNNN